MLALSLLPAAIIGSHLFDHIAAASVMPFVDKYPVILASSSSSSILFSAYPR